MSVLSFSLELEGAEFCYVAQVGLGLAMPLLPLPSAGSMVMCDPARPTGLHF